MIYEGWEKVEDPAEDSVEEQAEETIPLEEDDFCGVAECDKDRRRTISNPSPINTTTAPRTASRKGNCH